MRRERREEIERTARARFGGVTVRARRVLHTLILAEVIDARGTLLAFGSARTYDGAREALFAKLRKARPSLSPKRKSTE